MKILIVCSKNSGKIAPFILDQAESLEEQGIKIDFFTISRKGLHGYLSSRKELLQKIKEFQPNIIHAHYGLSGLLANLQRKIPVVAIYHGSDINNRKILRFSKIAILLSKFNIFVSQKNIDTVKPKRNYALIPCGVDTKLFKPLDKHECRIKLGFSENEKLVLFAGAFDNKVKNAELAHQAISLLQAVKLIELKGFTRQEVAILMNAVDAVLMTSRSEGSPQFIKEAMACNCPIVSVNVGDVKEVIFGVEGCFISINNADEIAENLQKAISFGKTAGREKIIELGLDSETTAKKIINIYKQVIK